MSLVSMVGGVLGQQGADAVTILSDTFTDIGGTKLGSHTPEVGTWTDGAGNFEIGAGGTTLVIDSTGFIHTAGVDAGGDVTINVDYSPSAVVSGHGLMVLAHNSPSTWWSGVGLYCINLQIEDTYIFMSKWGGGARSGITPDSSSTYSSIAGTTVGVQVVVVGTTITVDVDGVERLSHTLSAGDAADVSGNTWCGVGTYKANGAAGHAFDNLVIGA